MAMSIDRIAGLLDELDLSYQEQDGYLFVNMETQVYRDEEKQGDKDLTLMLEVEEEGEFFTLLAPRAYFVRGKHQDAFLRACALIQWRTRLVKFAWDAGDGEVRPTIQLPLEDGEITRRQLQRSIYAICSIIDQYHEALQRAATEGVVALPGDETDDDEATAAPDPAFLARVKAVLTARGAESDAAGDESASAGEPAADSDQDTGPPTML